MFRIDFAIKKYLNVKINSENEQKIMRLQKKIDIFQDFDIIQYVMLKSKKGECDATFI